jgi:hypothetical protein
VIACRPNPLLTVEVLSPVFRRLFLEMVAAHDAGRLHFFGHHSRLADKLRSRPISAAARDRLRVVYAAAPFVSDQICNMLGL